MGRWVYLLRLVFGKTTGDSLDIMSFDWLFADSIGVNSFGILLGVGVSYVTPSGFGSGMS